MSYLYGFWTKWLNFADDITEVHSEWSIQQKASTDSVNGMVPNKHQAITWTEDDPVADTMKSSTKCHLTLLQPDN